MYDAYAGVAALAHLCALRTCNCTANHIRSNIVGGAVFDVASSAALTATEFGP